MKYSVVKTAYDSNIASKPAKGVEIADLLHNDMFPVLATCLIEMKLKNKFL